VQSVRITVTSAAMLMVPMSLQAETFRCGNVLVSGDTPAAEIVAKCGPPSHKEVSEVEPLVRNQNGVMVRLPTVRTETWTFDRGPKALAMKVTIVDGKVMRVESVK